MYGLTGVTVNLTPISQMGTEVFARKMTGSDNLSLDQKKQIREQQEVSGNVVVVGPSCMI